MNVLIRDASMEAIRKCGRATHFKLVSTPEGNKYTPCSPSDPKGQAMKMLDIKSGQLLTPPLEIVFINFDFRTTFLLFYLDARHL